MYTHAEIEQRQAERAARRQARREHEQMVMRALSKVRFVTELLLIGAIGYAYLFIGCLIASM